MGAQFFQVIRHFIKTLRITNHKLKGFYNFDFYQKK